MKPSWLITAFFLFLFCNLFSQTRDPWFWPFSSESIWNMPIHKDAWIEGNFEDADIDITGLPSRFKAEGVQIFLEDTANPLQEYHRVLWTDRCSNHYHYHDAYVHFPDDYVWDGEENSQKNSTYAMIKADHETIWDATLFTRCTEGSWVGGAWFAPDRPYSIYGDGYGKVITYPDQVEDIWGHGASKMSAFGGTIRKGELTSPENEPIRHALKFTIYAHWYLASCEVFGGKPFIWPAQGADGGACNTESGNHYGGTNTDFVMGTLLALPPDITKEDLGITTLAARKIFDALQTYGAYVVENSGWDNWQFLVEEEAIPTDWPAGDHSSITAGVFFNELRSMIKNLHIIKLNTPDNIAGGPTHDHENRMASIACEPGVFGSGSGCPFDPDVSILSPANGSTLPLNTDINIEATASDADGEVDTVKFYVNGELEGIDTTEPYSLSINKDTDGEYLLKAVAVDNSGSTTTSLEISIYLGNRSPEVSIVSPVQGAIFFEGEKITLQADSEDPDGRIEKVIFVANKKKIFEDIILPYASYWTPEETGNYEITAISVDDDSDTTRSDNIDISVFKNFSKGEEQFPNQHFNYEDTIWYQIQDNEAGGNLEIVSLDDNFILKAFNNSISSDQEWSFGVGNDKFQRAFRENENYELEFEIKSDGDQNVKLESFCGDRSILGQQIVVSNNFTRYSYVLEPEERGRMRFFFTPGEPLKPVYLDNLSLIRGVKPYIEILSSDTFYVNHEAEIIAQATDADGSISQVEFFLDEVSVAVDHTQSYSIDFTPLESDEGVHTLKAVAEDNDLLTREAVKSIIILSGSPSSTKVMEKPKKSVKIFPNPSSSNIFLSSSFESTIESISILDATGKNILNLNNTSGSFLIIQKDQLPGKGLYFIIIQTSSGLISEKLIIQK